MNSIVMFGIAGSFFVVILAVAFVLLGRLQRTDLHSGFKMLGDSFEAFQRNLLHAQKEFERSQEVKSATLRQELGQELQSNRKELQHGLTQTTTSLEARVTAIDSRIDSRLKELTNGVQTRLDQNVKEGFRHFEKVQEHLKQAEIQLLGLNSVGKSITDLNNLLKLPHLRGGFGEATLERLLADLLPVDSYELQYRISPTSTERVDAVIKYPKYVLPIDSKFPREQVLPLFETNDPVKLEEARKNLIEVMRILGKSIKEKYIRPDCGTADMALLFVPSETLYFEMIRSPKLCDELAKNKVFAVSPNTLAVTLHAISIARNYYDMAAGVEKTISEIKRSQQHFEHFERKFDDVGNALVKSQNAFGVASTHLSRYRSAVTRLTGAEADLETPPATSSIPASTQMTLETS